MGYLETNLWKSYWNKRGREISDLDLCIGRTPDLLSTKTKEWIWKQIVCSLELKVNDVLVDAGCGVGDSIVKIGKVGLIIGVDFADTLLKLAKTRVEHLDNHVVFINGSIVNLPLKDETIDKAISISVLQYIPDDLLFQTLNELVRIMRNEGIIVIHCKNSFIITNIKLALLRRLLFFKRKITTPIERVKQGNLSAYYRPYWRYKRLIKKLDCAKIEKEWSFALFSWRWLQKRKLNKIVELLEVNIRKRLPFLLRPFGIEYYFKIVINKDEKI